MVEHYLDRLARTINENWDQPALTDFYLTEDGAAQDTSRGNHYTYGEMYEEMCRLCDLFTALGLQKGNHIAICGANSAHWAIAYLAIAAYQGVAVTILHSQSPEDIAHQIDFSDAKALFADVELWIELKSKSFPQVKHVISLEDWSVVSGGKIEIPNRKSLIANREVSFDYGETNNLAMICFTSGSTGISKGVMLNYKSLNNNIYNFEQRYIKSTRENYVIFLPIAHMAGFLAEFLPQILRGSSVYFLCDIMSIKTIGESIKTINPYMVTEVPQVIISIGKTFGYGILCGLKQLLLGCAVLDSEMEKELLLCKIPLIVGYGQTEVGAAISMSFNMRHKVRSSGQLLDNMQLKISDNGEILVKGENVMLGYYKNPEATARKIDADGWLHTGDKGHLDEDGYLYVEGRLEQDMIVLPNGENIHPEDIERKINALPEVKESIVLARDGKLVAIVVPSSESRESSESSETRASSPSSSLRRIILRNVNPQLPLYSQLYDVGITSTPLQKTEKQTLKRYLYK